MIVFGLTGSIGMGKSTAAKMFKILRVPVHDSDRAVHRALMPGGAAFEMVAVTFPDAWDKKNRVIDRQKLGEIVFADPAQRKKLEAILHPIAQESQADFKREMRRKGKRAIVLEIPLLFETGAESRVDYTICVTAPIVTQRRRVMARKGMSAEKFARIVQSQMPDGEKQARSDFIIQTGMGFAHTFKQVRKILRETGV